jgi:hypothetical protein
MSPLHSRSQARRQSGKTTDSHAFCGAEGGKSPISGAPAHALVVSLPRTA